MVLTLTSEACGISRNMSYLLPFNYQLQGNALSLEVGRISFREGKAENKATSITANSNWFQFEHCSSSLFNIKSKLNMDYLQSDRSPKAFWYSLIRTSRCSSSPESRRITYLFPEVQLNSLNAELPATPVPLSASPVQPVAISIQECSLADSTFMTIESLIALWHTFIYESWYFHKCASYVSIWRF